MKPFSLNKSFSYTQEQVNDFAKITGDNNPIHLDEEYAAKSKFGKRIIHGYLGASIFSKLFGTEYPGYGTMFLKQTLTFWGPMYVDDTYFAVITLLEVYPEKARALFSTKILDRDDKVILEGEALIKHEIFASHT